MHSSICQKSLVSKPVPLYLFTFYSLLVLLVEHHGLEFLDAIHSPPLEITEYNGEQHIKDCSGLFAQVVLLLPIIPHLYYLLYDGLFLQE